jgi:DNA-directed RNA polymerase subunit RPC12/RpoP
MPLICIECKNQVDLSHAPQPIVKDQVVECNHCGISLLVTDVTDGGITAEIVDEGK